MMMVVILYRANVSGAARSMSIRRRWSPVAWSGVPCTSQRSSGMRMQLDSTRRTLNYSSLYAVGCALYLLIFS